MKSKKALVTGADGFIGSHLTELLLEKGYTIKALSYYNSFKSWDWLEGVKHPQLKIKELRLQIKKSINEH